MPDAGIQLSDEAVEAIAERVVELLDHEPTDEAALVDAATLARRLGRSRDYVYEHATELGAIRVGDGPRPRLLFDPHCVDALRSTNSSEPTAATKRPARRPRRSRATVPLLEVGPKR